MNLTRTRKPAALVAGTALALLALTACGDDSTSTTTAGSGNGGTSNSAAAPSASYGPPATGPHNAQDVTFVEDMLPHHSQAVEMADMALNRDTTPEVKQLARQIKAAQAPEISAMGGWLTGWGEQVPVADSMGGHSMSGMGSSGSMAGGMGMMSADEMTALDEATGTDFAKKWLTDMTEHHTGAVQMAQTELSSGQNPDAKQLATNIIASQTKEIATMKQLLARLA